MMMPSIFGERFMDDFFKPFGRSTSSELMRTDVEESESGYVVTMDIPGIKREDVQAELKDGYLTVNVSASSDKNEQQEDGKYIRRERYYGSASRSFYVGDAVTQEDIKAKFENGTLRLEIPKKDVLPQTHDAHQKTPAAPFCMQRD